MCHPPQISKIAKEESHKYPITLQWQISNISRIGISNSFHNFSISITTNMNHYYRSRPLPGRRYIASERGSASSPLRPLQDPPVVPSGCARRRQRGSPSACSGDDGVCNGGNAALGFPSARRWRDPAARGVRPCAELFSFFSILPFFLGKTVFTWRLGQFGL